MAALGISGRCSLRPSWAISLSMRPSHAYLYSQGISRAFASGQVLFGNTYLSSLIKSQSHDSWPCASSRHDESPNTAIRPMLFESSPSGKAVSPEQLYSHNENRE